MSFHIAVLISGRGSNLEALFHASTRPDSAFKISLVLSDKSSAGGLQFAEQNSIPTLVVPRKPKEQNSQTFNQALCDALLPYKPNLVVLAGFMRVIDANFIHTFNGHVINIHPSLLPLYRGLDAQAQALDAGAKESGCTVHYVTEEIDAGPIVAQAVVPILAGDTAEVLSSRILKFEHQLLPAVVNAIARGDIALVRTESGSRIVINKVLDNFKLEGGRLIRSA